MTTRTSAEVLLQAVLDGMKEDVKASNSKLEAYQKLWHEGEINYREIIQESIVLREKLSSFLFLLTPLEFNLDNPNDPITKMYGEFIEQEEKLRHRVMELEHAASMLRHFGDLRCEISGKIKQVEEGRLDRDFLIIDFAYDLGTHGLSVEDVKAIIRDIEKPE